MTRRLDANGRRYVELLQKVILNEIYRDPPIRARRRRRSAFDLLARREGRDWPEVAHSMVGAKRLDQLREAVETVVAEGVPGHVMETGVWRGGACILMRGVLEALEEDGRKVFVADSFEGLPPPSLGGAVADKGDKHYKVKELAVSVEEVEENFRRYGLLDDRVVFLKGFFEHTLPALEAGPFAVLRLDGDMYSSTMVALEHLYAKLSPGGYLIVDDYGAVEGCRMAVDEYRAREGIDAPMHTIDWTGRFWRKPR